MAPGVGDQEEFVLSLLNELNSKYFFNPGEKFIVLSVSIAACEICQFIWKGRSQLKAEEKASERGGEILSFQHTRLSHPQFLWDISHFGPEGGGGRKFWITLYYRSKELTTGWR